VSETEYERLMKDPEFAKEMVKATEEYRDEEIERLRMMALKQASVLVEMKRNVEELKDESKWCQQYFKDWEKADKRVAELEGWIDADEYVLLQNVMGANKELGAVLALLDGAVNWIHIMRDGSVRFNVSDLDDWLNSYDKVKKELTNE